MDGRLSLKGVARGRKKAVRQLVEYYFERRDADNPSRKTSSQAMPIVRKDMERFAVTFVAKQDENVLFMDSCIGPCDFGSHVGPDMLAIVFWGKDRRELICRCPTASRAK